MRVISKEKNTFTNNNTVVKKTTFEQIFLSKAFTIISTTLLVAFYVYFIIRHLVAYKNGASAILLLFVVLESVLILLYLTRRSAVLQTADFYPWVYAWAGTYTPLAFNPTGESFTSELALISTCIGCLLVLGTYFSLNSSMGIGPALRSVKTNGMYRFVRHPMYASYLFIYAGYILTSFTVWNLILVIVVCFFQIKRALYEECLLQTSDEYRVYMERVPWRFFPGLV